MKTCAAALATLGVLLLGAGCGGSSASDITGPAPPGDGGAEDARSDASLLPIGTCTFQATGVVSGPRSGTAYASMNGSGNLKVFCGDFPGAAGEQLELAIGNGTYDGARAYAIDQTHHDGNVRYTVDKKTLSPESLSAGCLVTVTSAPSGSLAPRGSAIVGSFTCEKLSEDAASTSTLGLANGLFNVPVR